MGGAVIFATLALAVGTGPELWVSPAHGAGGVEPEHTVAATQQVRRAVAASEISLVDSEEAATCRSPACAVKACAELGCDFALLTLLSRRDNLLDVRLLLVDARTGETIRTTLNSGEAAYGTATLDLGLLAEDLLVALSGAPPPMAAAEPIAVVSQPPEEMVRVPRKAIPVAPVTPGSGENTVRGWADMGGLVDGGKCGLCSRGSGRICMPAKAWKRYRRYKRGGKKVLASNSTTRLSPRVWAIKQNKESMVLNMVWASPLPVLLISLFVQSGVLAVLGFFLMPVAAIAALIDASNIGSVTYCFEPSPGSPARMAP